MDARLTALGWRIVRHSQGISLGSLDKVAVEELPTASGPADYALFVSGKLLGIIEAKKVTVNPQNVLEQAKRYSEGAFNGVGNWGGLRVPFLYASNGEINWHLDVRPAKRVSRQLKGFHSPEALQWLFNQDSTPSIDWLLHTPPERIERLRTYQRSCIIAVEKEIIAGKRDLMVAMATGTGKTSQRPDWWLHSWLTENSCTIVCEISDDNPALSSFPGVPSFAPTCPPALY
jgi:type I restriction enzyme, R subunit